MNVKNIGQTAKFYLWLVTREVMYPCSGLKCWDSVSQHVTKLPVRLIFPAAFRRSQHSATNSYRDPIECAAIPVSREALLNISALAVACPFVLDDRSAYCCGSC